MSAETYNITTKTKVKNYLNISSDSDNDLLDTLCNSITAWIEKFCNGRRFKSTEYTEELYDGDNLNGRWLQTNNYPVTSWTKLEYNAGSTSNPNWVEYDESDYETYNNQGIVWFDRLETGKRNIRVTYTAGYDSMPYDLELLATKMVARTYEKRLSEHKESEGSPDLNISWGKFLQPEDIQVLNNYSRAVL